MLYPTVFEFSQFLSLILCHFNVKWPYEKNVRYDLFESTAHLLV